MSSLLVEQSYWLFAQAIFSSIHHRLNQYQTDIGNIIANQLQSSMSTLLMNKSWVKKNTGHGRQYSVNSAHTHIKRAAPTRVSILEKARNTHRGVLSVFSIQDILYV